MRIGEINMRICRNELREYIPIFAIELFLRQKRYDELQITFFNLTIIVSKIGGDNEHSRD